MDCFKKKPGLPGLLFSCKSFRFIPADIYNLLDCCTFAVKLFAK